MEGYHSAKPSEEGKDKYPREKKDTSVIVKGNNVTPTSHKYDNKCFRCLSFDLVALQCFKKRVIVMKANNKVEIDEEGEEEKMSPLKDVDDVCVEYQLRKRHLW